MKEVACGEIPVFEDIVFCGCLDLMLMAMVLRFCVVMSCGIIAPIG